MWLDLRYICESKDNIYLFWLYELHNLVIIENHFMTNLNSQLIINALCLTPRISNGGLLVVLWLVLRTNARVPGQVIALKSTTAHTRNR